MILEFIRRLLPGRRPELMQMELHGGPLDGLEGKMPRSQLRGGVWRIYSISGSIACYAFQTPAETELVDGEPVMVWHGRHVGYERVTD